MIIKIILTIGILLVASFALYVNWTTGLEPKPVLHYRDGKLVGRYFTIQEAIKKSKTGEVLTYYGQLRTVVKIEKQEDDER